MSKRRRSNAKNPLAGCLPGLLLLGGAVALLSYGSNAPVSGGGGALVAPWLFWAVLVVGGVFVVSVVRGRIGLVGILIACVVVAALIALNGTDAMPLTDNPCPGDEVVLVVGGKCRGMDGDANRAWLERVVNP